MNKKKYLLLVVFVIVVILISISTTFGPSKSVSRYRSEINGESSARVAKWKVTGVTKKRGQSISLDAGFQTNILEGEGNWFFDIENGSEVTAAINKDNSSITLRLAAEKLKPYETTESDGSGSIKWNYLGTTNPISFKIYAYNTSAADLLFYQKIDDATSPLLSFADFAKKADAEKLNYKEIVIDKPEFKKSLVFETKGDDTTFIREKDSAYYELSINLSQLTDLATNLGLGDNKTNICFQVAWKVEASGDFTTPSGEVQTYDTHTLVEGTPSDALVKKYEIDGKTYYIDTEKKEFFDYITYTSSLGGEPRFKFSSETSNEQISVPYSKLSETQKTQIEGYATLQSKENFASLEELEHFVEYLEYMQYNEFVEYNEKFKEFSKSLPYLNMGVQFSMQFNLLVEQVN